MTTTVSLQSFRTFYSEPRLYCNNRILGNYKRPVFEFYGNITNSVFDDNGAFDEAFQAYCADFYMYNGPLNDNGLTAARDRFLETSQWVAKTVD